MAGRVFTVPNQLTLLRLGFLPFVIITIHDRHYPLALVLLALAALTDGMDGLLARSLNQKTALGAYLDPIADKLLLSSSFVALSVEGQLRWWLTILVLSRDVFILITAALIVMVYNYRDFPPSLYGKLTTAAQILLVFAVLAAAVFQTQWLPIVRAVLVFAVAGLTVFSGFHYSVVVARRVSQQ